MARLFNGSSDYVRFTTPITAMPFSISAWAYATADNNRVAGIYSSTNNDNWIGSIKRASGSALMDQNANGGTDYISVTGGAWSASTWVHILSVWESTTSRALYFNGTKTTSTTSKAAPSGLDRFSIGVLDRPLGDEPFSGNIGETAMWDVALTDAEATSLSKGASAYLVRPQSLVFYSPDEGKLTTGKDFVGGLSASTTGGSAGTTHPRIYGR